MWCATEYKRHDTIKLVKYFCMAPISRVGTPEGNVLIVLFFTCLMFNYFAGSLPPSPADSGVSDVDSSSSGHASAEELAASRLAAARLHQLLPPFYPPPHQPQPPQQQYHSPLGPPAAQPPQRPAQLAQSPHHMQHQHQHQHHAFQARTHGESQFISS